MKFCRPLTSSSLLTIIVRGVSNKHCLLPFSIGIVSLRNMPMHYAMVFKGCKNDIL